MSEPALAAAILELVRDRDYVSFLELEREVPGFSGELSIGVPDCDNLIFWHAASAEAIAGLQHLLSTDQVHLKTCSSFIYAVDGAIVTIPQAAKRRSYSKLHWLPVTVCKGAGKRA